MDNKITEPQHNNFYEDQDITIDLDELYRTIIKPIDNQRSNINFRSIPVDSAFNQGSIDSLIAKSDSSSQKFQESRCSAFYRMIGFPVVGDIDSNDFYSPGFDPDLNLNSSGLQEHFEIANGFLNKYKALVISVLSDREQIQLNAMSTFSNEDFNSIVLGITGSLPRLFNTQFKDGLGPLNRDPQNIDAPGRDAIIEDYSDKNIIISPKVKHIIKPFVVDPRVDLTVNLINKIAAPFLLDRSKLKFSPDAAPIRRPYIEKVISTRFQAANNKLLDQKNNVDGVLADVISVIKSDNDTTDPQLLKNAFNFKNLTSESYITERFLKILTALVKQLVYAEQKIANIRIQINWQPIPNKFNGPEQGSTLRAVDANESSSSRYITDRNRKIEKAIITLQNQKLFAEVNFDLGQSTSSLGDFAFSEIDDMVFNSVKNVVTFYDEQITTISNNRSELGNKANDLLRQIEIIMGDYSGLGLIDIFAIQMSLWAMNKVHLLGMLDNNAFQRMQTHNDLLFSTPRSDIKTALTQYELILGNTYKAIQKYYDDLKTGS